MSAAPVVDVHAHVLLPELQQRAAALDPAGSTAAQELEVRRNGHVYRQSYLRGVPTAPLSKDEAADHTGTTACPAPTTRVPDSTQRGLGIHSSSAANQLATLARLSRSSAPASESWTMPQPAWKRSSPAATVPVRIGMASVPSPPARMTPSAPQ